MVLIRVILGFVGCSPKVSCIWVCGMLPQGQLYLRDAPLGSVVLGFVGCPPPGSVVLGFVGCSPGVSWLVCLASPLVANHQPRDLERITLTTMLSQHPVYPTSYNWPTVLRPNKPFTV